MTTLLQRLDRKFFATVAGPVPASKKQSQSVILDAVALCLPDLMQKFSITSELQIAHFTAQICHESDAFCTTEEYASGAAYEGRKDLGNTQKGDGVRFKGHGLIQNTGRENAHIFTLWMRAIDPKCPDFEREPERMEEFPWAAWVAIWFWWTRSLSVLAERDDLLAITKKVNGGTNGLAQRGIYLARAKSGLAAISAAGVSASQGDFPVLHRGIDAIDAVECLQRLLTQAGYYSLSIDGSFGAGTEGALRLFQSKLGLKVDGLAGEKTFNALLSLTGQRRGGSPWTLA